jgi:hypothetical protein
MNKEITILKNCEIKELTTPHSSNFKGKGMNPIPILYKETSTKSKERTLLQLGSKNNNSRFNMATSISFR